MTMRFALESPGVLAGIEPGARIRFTFHQQGNDFVVTGITLLAGGTASGSSASLGLALSGSTT